MTRSKKIIKILFSQLYTWAALITIVLIEAGFHYWFSPPLLISAILFSFGIIMLFVWFILFIKSEIFYKIYNQSPYDTDIDEITTILESCPVPFKSIVNKCLNLMQKIRNEFKSDIFNDELDSILQGLVNLSKNHLILLNRIVQFGDETQKNTMQLVLDEQTKSIEETFKALKTFSGHLTLLEVQSSAREEIVIELQSINQGLKEAIKETQIDK